MGEAPDRLTLERHRDLEGRWAPWPRRVILTAIAVFALLALANVFGQRPATAVARTARADLTLYSPSRLRGGLLFSTRFHITAHTELKDATLVLEPGWAEGMAINTLEPSPLGEASRNGKLTFDLGHIPAGGTYILFMQEQVNATNIAWRRPASVELDDGDSPVARIHHTFTIYP